MEKLVLCERPLFDLTFFFFSTDWRWGWSGFKGSVWWWWWRRGGRRVWWIKKVLT